MIDNLFESIYNQTIGFENLEVIFVDDCSSDNSGSIIESYVEKYENVMLRVLDYNSGFAGKPRNEGLKLATAEYVMFLDSDDMILEKSCELLYDKIISNDVDMVSGNFSIQTMDNVIPWNHITNEYAIYANSIVDKPSLLILPPSIWSKIYRKDFLLDNKIWFNESLPGQDALFIYSVLINAKGMLYFNEPVIIYIKRDYTQITEKSITDNISYRRLIDYLTIYEKMYNVLKDFNPYYVIALSSHLNYWTTLFIKGDLTSNEKISLISKYNVLMKKINQHESDMELMQLLNQDQVNSAINMLNVQNNEIENKLLSYYPYLKYYQEKIIELNNELYKRNKRYFQGKYHKKYSFIDEKNFSKKDIKISVIIPINNDEKYIFYCLNSLINQTFKDFEIICIDDASTDDTPLILDFFSKKDSRIKIIKNNQMVGRGASKNIGINYASGEYIQFINSKDWLSEETLEVLYKTASESDCDVIMYKSVYYNQETDSFIKNEKFKNMGDMFSEKNLTYKEIGNERIFSMDFSVCNKFYKTSFIKNNLIYFPEGLLFEDIPYYFQTVFKAGSISFLNRDYYNERTDIASDDEEAADIIEISEIIYNFFITNNIYSYSKSNLVNYIFDLIIENYHLVNSEYKEEYFKKMKSKLNKFEREYLLTKDFEEDLGGVNREFYYRIRNSEDYPQFLQSGPE